MTERLPNLDDLAALVLVAGTGSIGQAAVTLGISQPSVSRRLTGLERTLRVPLLQRSPRGTTLTPAGRVVVDWASMLLGAAEDFNRSVSALRDQTAVAVRAGVSMTIAEHHAPGWIAKLHARSPDSVVSLMVGNSKEVADLVESGGADVGFLESRTVRRGLRRRRIGWDTLVVAVPPGHEWAARGRPLGASELAEARLLIRETGSGTRETLEQALRGAGLELRPGFVMGSNTALKSAAVAGMAPVVLSELAVAGEIAGGKLVHVRVADVDLRRPLSAVWRNGQPLPAGASDLLRVVLEDDPRRP